MVKCRGLGEHFWRHHRSLLNLEWSFNCVEGLFWRVWDTGGRRRRGRFAFIARNSFVTWPVSCSAMQHDKVSGFESWRLGCRSSIERVVWERSRHAD